MIARPRLLALLSTDAAVTVLCAPTGFGKTVLLNQWARTLGPNQRVLWMPPGSHLDGATFWDELQALVSDAGISIGGGPQPIYRRLDRALRRTPTPVVLVLDGVDGPADPEIVRHLYNMARTNSSLHLVVSMRSNQDWPAGTNDDSRLVGGADLALTLQETASLLARSGISEGVLDSSFVHRSADGWPALVTSIVSAVSDGPGADSAVTIRNATRSYLDEQVIDQLEREGLSDVALRSSVPERIDSDLADLLEPQTDGDALLDALVRTGFLLAERHAGQWVHRWPAAARTVLQQLLATREPEVARSAHASVARRLVDAGHPESAADHAIESGDHDLVLHIIERWWGRLLNSDPTIFDRAFAALPTSAIRANTAVSAVHDIRSNLLRYGSSADHLSTLPDPFPTDRQSLLELAHSPRARTGVETANVMMVALRCRGELDRAQQWAHHCDLLTRTAGTARPADVVSRVPPILLQVGITHLICGDFTGAAETLHRVFESPTTGVSSHVHRDAAAKIALLLVLRGQCSEGADWLSRHGDRPIDRGRLASYVDLTAAMARALLSIDRLDRDGWEREAGLLEPSTTWEKSWGPYLSLVHARAALLWGDRHGALERLQSERSRQHPWQGPTTAVAPLLDAVEAELLISLGRANQARNLLLAGPAHAARQAVLARLALLTAPPDVALRTATALAGTAAQPRAHVQILLVSAAAQNALRDRASAISHLHHAVQILRSTGLRYPLETVPAERFDNIIDQVADAQPLFDSGPGIAAPLSPPELNLVTLSEREQLILARVVRGQNMKQMAADLTVSYNTVKTQMRSLYAKLEASSREQAVAHARERGLL